jgi:hypothetical protein
MENKRDGQQDLELCQKAEKGPWITGGCSGRMITRPDGYFGDGFLADVDLLNNARFIAESRQALPHWIVRAMVAEKALIILLDSAMMEDSACPADYFDESTVMCTLDGDCCADNIRCFIEHLTKMACTQLQKEGVKID